MRNLKKIYGEALMLQGLSENRKCSNGQGFFSWCKSIQWKKLCVCIVSSTFLFKLGLRNNPYCGELIKNAKPLSRTV